MIKIILINHDDMKRGKKRGGGKHKTVSIVK